jgi:hydrogenase maturation protein HypF
MLLEAIADRSSSDSRPGRFDYPLPLSSGTPAAAGGFKPATPAATGGLKPATPAQLDWRPLFAAMWEDRRAGIAPGTLAFRFHRTLAAGIVAVSQNHPGLPVVLAGGVFQNRLLTELVVELLNDAGRLYLPGRIPPNDGGLSAGQLAVASQME